MLNSEIVVNGLSFQKDVLWNLTVCTRGIAGDNLIAKTEWSFLWVLALIYVNICKYVFIFEEWLYMEESRSSWSNEGCTFNLQDFSILFYFSPIEITLWSLNTKPALGKHFLFWWSAWKQCQWMAGDVLHAYGMVQRTATLATRGLERNCYKVMLAVLW